MRKSKINIKCLIYRSSVNIISLLYLQCSLNSSCYTITLSLSAPVFCTACRDLRYAKNKSSHKIPVYFTYHIVIGRRKMSCIPLAQYGLPMQDSEPLPNPVPILWHSKSQRVPTVIFILQIIPLIRTSR